MPLDPRDRRKLRDIVRYAGYAIEMLGGQTAEDLERDLKTRFAVLHCVELVGEAAGAVSRPVQDRHAQVPWPLITGMRNVLAHEYGRVEIETVYRVVVDDLPPLIEQVRAILEREPPAEQ